MRKRIYRLLVILPILYMLSFNGNYRRAYAHNIELTTANYMVNSETPVNITCNQLQEQFACANFNIVDEDTQRMILDEIKKSKPIFYPHGYELDIRAQMLITCSSSGEIDTLCFDPHSTTFRINGEYRVLSGWKLINFIFKLRKELGLSYNEMYPEALSSIDRIKIIESQYNEQYRANGNVSYSSVSSQKVFLVKDKSQQKLILDYVGSARKYLAFNFSGVDTIRHTVLLYYNNGAVDTLCFGHDKFFYINYVGWELKNDKILMYLNSLKNW